MLPSLVIRSVVLKPAALASLGAAPPTLRPLGLQNQNVIPCEHNRSRFLTLLNALHLWFYFIFGKKTLKDVGL